MITKRKTGGGGFGQVLLRESNVLINNGRRHRKMIIRVNYPSLVAPMKCCLALGQSMTTRLMIDVLNSAVAKFPFNSLTSGKRMI